MLIRICLARGILTAGILVASLFSQLAGAGVNPVDRVRGLNNDLLRVQSELRAISRGDADPQRRDAAALIQRRAEAFRELIQSNPVQALALALSPEALGTLAAGFPESASQLESHGSWEGTIEQWVADSADFSSSATVT